ncbi:uncharacterized protein LOC116014235 isoform X1 [Ipomoea triloba]|uniref:uncharacterized protein LOC116014235 isoform X1 n=2 Tax=Ipomoea triloba TaxID=35885 RepID=UPI00125D9828|nr:uncharacterized protein LOC116014235 isoform X1 [Ipomoea triloba]
MIQMGSFSRGKIDTAGGHYPHSQLTIWKTSLCPQIVARFLAMPQKNSECFPNCGLVMNGSGYSGHMLVQASKLKDNGEVEESVGSTARSTGNDISRSLNGKATKGSGTTARGRRLLKVREEKRKREYDRLHNYPAWAKVLEDACQHDTELRAVLGDSIGNPELMRKRVEERVRTKGRDFQKSKTGSVLAFKVSFRDFNPLDSYIWFELYGAPSDREVELIGSVVQAWYVMGRLGAFNSSNLQLANSSMDNNPLYDEDAGSKVMPSSFHDISDVEFQDNWGRVWVDLGTSDFFSIDVLLNCLTALSSEYLGIQQVVFGGRRMGDWEDGMTDPEDGYKYFKI